MLLFFAYLLSMWVLLWPRISFYIRRWVNLIQNLVLFIIISLFIIESPQECGGMVELTEIGHWGETDLYLFLYDGISLAYIWLTCFIFLIVFLASWGNTKKSSLLIFLLNIIQLLLIISFLSTDLLMFYISFESILIPMFILIGIWGSRSEKIKAGYYLFFYTLIGSTFFY